MHFQALALQGGAGNGKSASWPTLTFEHGALALIRLVSAVILASMQQRKAS